MTNEERLAISDVVHEAFIAVDEDGTEAAAATAVVMTSILSAATSTPLNLTVDRPFIFQIRDVPTGTVLFFGRVMDPTQ
jgi:serpin B